MKQTSFYLLFYLFVIITSFSGCKKFLDAKSDKKLIVPASLKDLQAIMDAPETFITNVDPGAGEVSTTDYYLTDAVFNALSSEYHRRMYTWQRADLFPSGSNEWYTIYQPVFGANTVLENIGSVQRTQANAAEWDNVKGQAHYFRAKFYLAGAFIWAPAYDDATATTDMGMVLRLSSDFNIPSVRSSVHDTYYYIIHELMEAVSLLPDTPLHLARPNRPAAYGLLARTYLAMRKYDSCAKYANLCLGLRNTLMNFNELTATATNPIKEFNPEVIIHSTCTNPTPLSTTRAKIVPELYQLYANNDLRKTVFFKLNTDGTYSFKGYYTGIVAPFTGISTNEVYLMRAEAYARLGRAGEAMADLNKLLLSRWKTGTFTPLTAADAGAALEMILLERRKELLLRGLRWMDIKRFNKEGAGISLSRTINGQTYTLPANDPRFALPLPEDIIRLAGIPQNPR